MVALQFFYFILEDPKTHLKFTRLDGHRLLLPFLSAAPALQAWSLGTLSRLTKQEHVWVDVEKAGLQAQTQKLLESRSAVVSEISRSLTGRGNLRSEFAQVGRDIEPIIKSEVEKL